MLAYRSDFDLKLLKIIYESLMITKRENRQGNTKKLSSWMEKEKS